MDELKIVFVGVSDEWEKLCEKIYQNMKKDHEFKVKIIWKRSDIRKIKNIFPPLKNTSCAFISPANSYGWMDGGIDDIYSIMFPGPPEIGKVVQNFIKKHTIYYNKPDCLPNYEKRPVLPIGSSIIVPTSEEKTYLVSAPTMVVSSNVSKSSNAYYATLASLKVIEKSKEKISVIYIPGMCTGCGCMPLSKAIKQMMEAIRDWGQCNVLEEDQSNSPFVYLPKDTHLKNEVNMSGHKFTSR